MPTARNTPASKRAPGPPRVGADGRTSGPEASVPPGKRARRFAYRHPPFLRHRLARPRPATAKPFRLEIIPRRPRSFASCRLTAYHSYRERFFVAGQPALTVSVGRTGFIGQAPHLGKVMIRRQD